jgi:hypothetical protein
MLNSFVYLFKTLKRKFRTEGIRACNGMGSPQIVKNCGSHVCPLTYSKHICAKQKLQHTEVFTDKTPSKFCNPCIEWQTSSRRNVEIPRLFPASADLSPDAAKVGSASERVAHGPRASLNLPRLPPAIDTAPRCAFHNLNQPCPRYAALIALSPFHNGTEIKGHRPHPQNAIPHPPSTQPVPFIPNSLSIRLS